MIYHRPILVSFIYVNIGLILKSYIKTDTSVQLKKKYNHLAVYRSETSNFYQTKSIEIQ